jgi:SNF2 family DNA or RNA helicase
MLIVDESVKLKNTTTRRFKSLRPMMPHFERRMILTGRPMPNGLEDLFGQIYILDLGERLGQYVTHFRNRYFVPTNYFGPHAAKWAPHPDAEERITAKIGDICLRMEADDYLELPPFQYTGHGVQLPKKVREKYDEFEQHFIVQLDEGEVTAANAAVLSGKLRQIANGFLYTGKTSWADLHDEKMTKLADIVDEAGRAIVFYEFVHDMMRIEKKFKKDVTLLKGTKKQIDRAIDKWNAGDARILLAHPASSAHGLNLQFGGNHLIWFGPTWNLDHYEQGNMRLRRPGQEAARVFVHNIIAEGTMDEGVIMALTAKAKTQSAVLKAIKKWRASK